MRGLSPLFFPRLQGDTGMRRPSSPQAQRSLMELLVHLAVHRLVLSPASRAESTGVKLTGLSWLEPVPVAREARRTMLLSHAASIPVQLISL